MKITAFDRDEILAGFLSDYLDQKLERAEQSAFDEYLKSNPAEKDFAEKAHKGKRILESFREELAMALSPEFQVSP
ncbi:MAG: hypothetical protein R3222_02730 [Balneolaceae bacterium]|nr:hypothetical protein [Balneolaceae bacterium]